MFKFSNKFKLYWTLLLLQFSLNFGSNVIDYNCTAAGNVCQNNGECKEEIGECICPYGWKGPECQYCSGKVRLTNKTGLIFDGSSFYTELNKCNWLIDATQSNWFDKQNNPPVILINLKEFATECGWDYLYIYDGDNVDSPLLAALSGEFPLKQVSQVIARSGSALLHFYSDDALNMVGFNLSYVISACPSDDEQIECSGHGKCKESFCICDSLYSGEACNIAACPNNCGEDKNQGTCNMEEERCICKEGYGGNDCGQFLAKSVWSIVIPKQSEPPPGTASHTAVVVNNLMYIIGGESYSLGNLMTTYDFKNNNWERIQTKEDDLAPEPRYGMSSVLYSDKIFIYGGDVKESGITNELWSFDIKKKIWENITVNTEACKFVNRPNAICDSLKVTGHSATLVTDKNNKSYMLVIFGRSPQYGYLNTVQEYNFNTNEWKIIETSGYVVKGTFGHSATYDHLTEEIYVYGGMTSLSDDNNYNTKQLYAYSPFKSSWRVLSPAFTGRSLHTAIFVNQGIMMVFSGNTYNDLTERLKDKCYSQDLLVYDVYCDSWHKHNIPKDLETRFERFGHTSVLFENDIYIYGGFNGQLINDMLRFSTGNCSYYTKENECINERPGVKCMWDVQNKCCRAISNVQHSNIYGRQQNDYIVCPPKNQVIATNMSLCNDLNNCESCLSNSYGCIYCGSRVCTEKNCKETTKKLNITRLENCPIKEDFRTLDICKQLLSCNACTTNTDCEWEQDRNRCLPYDASIKTPKFVCPPTCASLNSCYNCIKNDCIWCKNVLKCVDRNSYTTSFPYGQCREWTIHQSKCGLQNNSSTLSASQCNTYNSCSQCLDDPDCGWCDNNSNNGLGKCLDGGASRPHDNSQCSPKQWYFTSCPLCNCNGHSKCLDFQNCEQPCSNYTIGKHCEKCLNGYWGNTINGGVCHKCDCNGQGDSCHPETGKCYCNTKGTIGDHCEKCDALNKYKGDPKTFYCYYELTTDYQFTFNLSRTDEKHVNKIHYHNTPNKIDSDVELSIICSKHAKLDIVLLQPNKTTQELFFDISCNRFAETFTYAKYQIKQQWPKFHVTVKDFKSPILIKIAFAQYPKLNILESLFGNYI